VARLSTVETRRKICGATQPAGIFSERPAAADRQPMLSGDGGRAAQEQEGSGLSLSGVALGAA
jgi:hypothetical protein